MFLVVPVTLFPVEERTKAEVARRVKERMDTLELTAAALRTQADVDRNTVRDFLSAKRRLSVENQYRFDAALGFEPGGMRRLYAGEEPILRNFPEKPSVPTDNGSPGKRQNIYDDAVIAGFPAVFSSLPRDIQLDVISYVADLTRDDRLPHKPKDGNAALLDGVTAGAIRDGEIQNAQHRPEKRS